MLALLQLLAQSNEKTSEKIAALLQLEPCALQQKIMELQELGVQIQQDETHIKLIPQLTPLDTTYLQHQLQPYYVQTFSVIDSTNQYLLNNLQNLAKGAICLADYQLAGRGRRGRQWRSAFAGQILLSCYWTLPNRLNLEGLSCVVGIAVAKALQKADASHIQLKWPNDILLNGKKLAGILLELAPQKNQQWQLVIGIGVNLSLGSQTEIDQPWAQLIDSLPQLDRNQLIVKIIQQLYAELAVFEQHGMATFQTQWQQYDAYFNQDVRIIGEKEQFEGVAKGINQQGYLQLKHAEKGMLYFSGGEVSLRKQ